jgi:hypothetical protein
MKNLQRQTVTKRAGEIFFSYGFFRDINIRRRCGLNSCRFLSRSILPWGLKFIWLTAIQKEEAADSQILFF